MAGSTHVRCCPEAQQQGWFRAGVQADLPGCSFDGADGVALGQPQLEAAGLVSHYVLPLCAHLGPRLLPRLGPPPPKAGSNRKLSQHLPAQHREDVTCAAQDRRSTTPHCTYHATQKKLSKLSKLRRAGRLSHLWPGEGVQVRPPYVDVKAPSPCLFQPACAHRNCAV